MTPHLCEIYIAAAGAEPVRPVEQVMAIPGTGLSGDRYGMGNGTWSEYPDQTGVEVTLIEAEMIERMRFDSGVELGDGLHRRNLVVRGVNLQGLIGRQFTVGDVVLEGVRPCLPCEHVERVSGAAGAKRALLEFGKGGLRARIVKGGKLKIGDHVEAPTVVTESA